VPVFLSIIVGKMVSMSDNPPFSPPSQWRLLRQRRFAPFFVAQLAGAFNDNLYKQILVLLISFHANEYGQWSPGVMSSLAGGIFILPFVLFSALAGQLSDRFDKSRVILTVKMAEVVIMLMAATGLWLHSVPLLLLVLFFMGCHSAFFSPAKYSLLPRVLAVDELVGGNGLLEMGTFVSIILGGLLAGVMVGHSSDVVFLGSGLLGVAGLGLLAACRVPRVAPVVPEFKIDWNPFRTTRIMLLRVRQQPALFVVLLAISWFWFFGAVFLAQLPVLVKTVWNGTETTVSLVLALFALGVGLGSASCERLGGRHLDPGLVLWGGIGMAVFALDFSGASTRSVPPGTYLDWVHCLRSPQAWHALADVGLLGISGGIFSVPLYAYVQTVADPGEQSRVVAANNVLNAIFMVLSAIYGVALSAMGAGPVTLLVVCAAAHGVVMLILCRRQPMFYQAALARFRGGRS
jgi:MFS family permease